MSQPQSPFAARPAAPRLGIIHFLGWMIGVGAILAIFRATTNEADFPANWLPWVRMQQLGFGVAYGTAISGLCLFFWRWWRGAPGAPSQPGHWLLIFGGIGIVIDLTATQLLKLVLYWSGTGVEFTYFGAWLFYQATVWWLGAVIATIVLYRLRNASFWWTLTTLAAVLVLTLNSLAPTISFYGFMQGAGGSWLWQVPLMVRVANMCVVLPILWTAEVVDRRRRVPRDWLHGAGVVAVSGLGLVDLVSCLVTQYR